MYNVTVFLSNGRTVELWDVDEDKARSLCDATGKGEYPVQFVTDDELWSIPRAHLVAVQVSPPVGGTVNIPVTPVLVSAAKSR